MNYFISAFIDKLDLLYFVLSLILHYVVLGLVCEIIKVYMLLQA